MTLLVTGASGFIGRAVLALLKQRGHEVTAVQHRWRDEAALDGVLPADVDACLHLGWYADARDYLTNESESAHSAASTLMLAEALLKRGCTRIVVAGTSAEYAPAVRAHVEDDVLAPQSVYGKAKVETYRRLCNSLEDRVSLGWARIFNVTGPGEQPTRLLPHVARSVLAQRRVSLSAGEQVRDFLHVDDVAAGLVSMLDAGVNGPINVSRGTGVSVRHVVTALAGRLGGENLLDFGAIPRSPADPDHVVGDSSQLRSLGWKPAYSLQVTLDATAEYWRVQALSGG